MTVVTALRAAGAVLLAGLAASARPQPVAPTADEPPAVAVGGHVHADARLFLGDEDRALTDDLLIRRARASFQDRRGRLGGLLGLELGGGKAFLLDAFVEARLPLGVKVRLGKQTPPIGLERIHSLNGLTFVEMALPADLSPLRDVGLLVSRDFGRLATIAVGLFAGAPDGAHVDGDVSDDKDVVARIRVRPFALGRTGLLTDLALGVAGSYGATRGTARATELAPLRSDGQAAFFEYRKGAAPTADDTVVASGRRTRVALHGSWYAGPLLLLGEYAVSQQRIVLAGRTARPGHAAWQATAAWAITGEKSSEEGLVPASPLDRGGLGGLQIKARVAALDVDDDVFPVFAAPERAATRATAFGAGLTWWATGALRLELDYCQTAFEGGAGTSPADVRDRPTERAILSRVQLVFR